ncbi:MAG TPA: adenylate/guanylate cyclase domain-containing protein [Kofleriaceae bacterium]|nr:adenylate/guanylate cyclase domain-containing protein [Kofleriaceae bacterium]
MRRARNAPLLVAMIAATVAILIVALHVYLAPLAGLNALEDLTIDARFHLRGPRPAASDRVVIIGIDDETRARFPELMQTRRGYAALVRALTKYDVKVIAFDLFFSAPETLLSTQTTTEVRALDLSTSTDPLAPILRKVAGELRGDDDLAAAIAESHRVFLGAFFRPGTGASAPEPSQLKPARFGETADSNGGGNRRPIHATSVDFTLDSIARGAIGAGAINDFRDRDGVRRRMPLAIELGAHIYMPLGLAVAAYDRHATTSYVVGDDHLTLDQERIPVGRAASLWLDDLGRDQLPRISAARVLDGTAPASALKDKLAFVGLTFSTYDKVATPLDPVADGIELHATLAENVLSNHLLHHTDRLVTLACTLVICLVVVITQLRTIRRRTWIPPLAALTIVIAYILLCHLTFTTGTVANLTAPTLAAIVTAIAASIGALATEGREKAHLRAMFSRYVSRSVVDRILADPARAKLGGERKELTVLFSDIRGFSKFSETMKPEDLASFLNEYLTPMTELVLESGGTLDKYIGDAVMAVWSAPVDVPDHAARACRVALRMQEALAMLNTKWKRENKPAIAIGIGLNTGVMAVGNMGTAQRFDYTVLGDQVNLGARLESLTKEYGVDILVGEATVKAAGDQFVFREIDLVRVKGRTSAAPVFELVGRSGLVKTDARYSIALADYRARDFAGARVRFEAIAKKNKAAAVMADRCAILEQSPPPADWDGVYDQRGK